MPTYQYACSKCGHQFETVQGFHEDSLNTCPDCGEQTLRKLFGNVGVVFKGSGFYRTDSRKDGRSATKSSSAPAKPSGSESAPAKSSEPATKTAASTDK